MDLFPSLNPFASKSDDEDKPKSFFNPIGGRLGFFDDNEDIFEKESSPNPFTSVPDALKETTVILTDLAKEAFPVRGSISFQEKPSTSADAKADKEKQQEAYRKKDFYQTMQVNSKNLEQNKMEQAMADLARMEVAGMSSTEKNMIEGLNANLKAEYTNNPYHINNIRRKKLEQIKQAKRQKEQQEIVAASRGKSLVNNLDAQEGQSITSASGAIASAG